MSHAQRICRIVPVLATAVLAAAVASAGLAGDARAQGSDGSTGSANPGTPPDGQPFVPGEVLVRFKPSAGPAQKDAIRDAAGVELEERLPLPGVQQVETEPGTGVREAARKLESRGAVDYAEPNFLRYPQATPDDEHFGALWGLQRIDAPTAWDTSIGSSDVTVAIVDTGVAYDHPDLAANMWANPTPATAAANGDPCAPTDDVQGWDFVDCDNDPSDEMLGHGTHVAGTIGAAGDNGIGVAGVNWDVSIMPLRVLGPDSGSVADIVAAFTYARDHGADIVNASFGGHPHPAEEEAISAAPEVLFVAAAGNDGTDNDQQPFAPCSYSAANLICVAASDQNDELADFYGSASSNFGRHSVDLAAPGVNTLSTRGHYFFEDFEARLSATGWTTGGTSPWARTARPAPDDRDDVLADSPGGDYANGADTFAQSRSVDLTGRTGCRLDYQLEMDIDPGESPASFDYLAVEASTDGTNWQTLLGDEGSPAYEGPTSVDAPGDATGPVYTGAHEGPVSNDLSAFEDTASFMVRFRLVTDDARTADGLQIDDVAADCRSWTPTGAGGRRGYASMSGTSMAAPHASGVAALALARQPGASVLDLRAALLDSGDPASALEGKTVTGRRLNAVGSLLAIDAFAGTDSLPAAPVSTITGDPPTRTRLRKVSFSFTADNPDVQFYCQIDASPWSACQSPFRTAALGDGTHNFKVVARRPGGSFGAPDRHDFLVDGTGPVMGFPAAATMRRAGVARVRLTCPASELSGPCQGELTLRTKDRVKVGRKSKRLRLGTGSFTIASGATRRVRVPITSRGQAVVKRESPLPVVGRAVTGDALGNVRTSRGLFTLRFR